MHGGHSQMEGVGGGPDRKATVFQKPCRQRSGAGVHCQQWKQSKHFKSASGGIGIARAGLVEHKKEI